MYAQYYLQGIWKLFFLLSWTQIRGHGEGQAILVLSQGHTEQLAKLVRGSDPRTLDPVVALFIPWTEPYSLPPLLSPLLPLLVWAQKSLVVCGMLYSLFGGHLPTSTVVMTVSR